MPQLEITGTSGIITDIPQHELPPDAWSAGQNVRVIDGQIEKFLGHQDFATPTVTPYYVLPVPETSGSDYYWLYMGLAKAYAYDGTSHYNVTNAGGDYTGSASDRWNGGLIGGLALVNNGKDDPQMWNPVGSGQVLQDLTAWPATTTCKVMRVFKDFILALDVTESGTRYPHVLRWSNSADAGAIPTSWDYTDTANDSGRVQLSDSSGYLIDCMPLRGINILYKEDMIIKMAYTGDGFVFDFDQNISETTGILTQGCMAEFSGRHFVATGGEGDIIIHDGQNIQSIADRKTRRAIFNNIDTTNYAQSFVAPNLNRNEIWFCYPETGSSLPNMAAVWNIKENKWGFREIPDVAHIAAGIINTGTITTWATVAETWGSITRTWGQRGWNPTKKSLIMAGTGLWEADQTNQFDGVSMTANAERTGISIGGQTDVNTITRVYPRMEGSAVNIYVGSQMDAGGAITWEGPYAFTPGSDYKIDCRVTGRLHGIKIETTTDVAWKMSGYTMEYEYAGGR